jgi:hypothetical protein
METNAPLTIHRTRIITLDLVVGSVVGLLVAGLMAVFSLYSRSLVLAMCLAGLPFLVYIALRRYLRSITLDPGQGLLIAHGIFPWITYSIPFSRIKAVRRVKRMGGCNLVVRRLRTIQPLIFEVWTAEEDRAVQSFWTAWANLNP